MFALVMFVNQPMPVTFGISNVGYADYLLTMANVEWVQVITGSGVAVRPHDDTRYTPLKP